MAFLMWAKSQQFFDNSGNPLNGGKIRIYDAGTLSAKTVYQDTDEDVAWSQPITLDSAGRPEQPIYIGAGPWKYTLETSAGAVFITEDDIPGDTVLTVDEFARPNMPVLSKSISYTVLADDIGSMIQADATGGDVTITLISAVTAGDGAQIGVQNVGSANRVIVAVPGGETVNGASTIQILKTRAGGVFTSNAGSWSGPVTDQPYTTLSKTTTYTVASEDYGRTIKCSGSGGAFTVTLPPAATVGDGFEVTIKKTDTTANAVTVDGNASETIDGATSVLLGWQYRSITVRCDGSNWDIVRETAPDKPSKIVIEPTNTLPAGWLWCNGEPVSRTTYASLFAFLGTTYGVGDGSTTFNVPDLCGRVVAGQDDMGAIASKNRLTGVTGSVNGDTLGAAGGEETHVLTTGEHEDHNHQWYSQSGANAVGIALAASSAHQGYNSAGALTELGNPMTANYYTAVKAQLTAAGAHNNVQPTIVLNYIIKT